MKQRVIKMLGERGVTVQSIAEIVLTLQKKNIPDLTIDMCAQSILSVLEKREAQHAILTGIALDVLTEKGFMPPPLDDIIRRDEPLYGVDEILALAITNIYGGVGLTTFGYLDKVKFGVIGKVNDEHGHRVHTFLDDLIAGVAAAAAARLIHQHGRRSKEGSDESVAL